MPDRPQKITFADMRDMGVRGLLIYCSDYKCRHPASQMTLLRQQCSDSAIA